MQKRPGDRPFFLPLLLRQGNNVPSMPPIEMGGDFAYIDSSSGNKYAKLPTTKRSHP
jgi:hypothetical protein